MKTTLGYLLLILSCLTWVVIALLPFVGYIGIELSITQIASYSTGLFIAGEVLFYLSVIFLGKEIIQKFKKLFCWYKRD